jgi:hypothetical protein
MFRWYKHAAVCYAYLSDLDDDNTLSHRRGGTHYAESYAEYRLRSDLPNCRWFQRGWTLQELIAPPNIIFFSRNWHQIGPHKLLVSLISSITGIDIEVINHDVPISTISVAARMSWAARRKTTRTEDTAYCLLGIFEVNMPLLYGEGDRAFLRLQEEIMKVHGDLSLFAWGLDKTIQPMNLDMLHPVHTLGPGELLSDVVNFSGLFASSPKDFEFSDNIGKFAGLDDFMIHELSDYPLPPMVMNGGLRIELAVLYKDRVEESVQLYNGRQLCNLACSEDFVVFAVLDCTSIRADGSLLAVPLIAWNNESFGRAGGVVYVDITENMEEYEEKHGSRYSHMKELQERRKVLFIKAPPQTRGKRRSMYPTAYDTGLLVPDDVRAQAGGKKVYRT